jgi:hypothetical protein
MQRLSVEIAATDGDYLLQTFGTKMGKKALEIY